MGTGEAQALGRRGVRAIRAGHEPRLRKPLDPNLRGQLDLCLRGGHVRQKAPGPKMRCQPDLRLRGGQIHRVHHLPDQGLVGEELWPQV